MLKFSGIFLIVRACCGIHCIIIVVVVVVVCRCCLLLLCFVVDSAQNKLPFFIIYIYFSIVMKCYVTTRNRVEKWAFRFMVVVDVIFRMLDCDWLCLLPVLVLYIKRKPLSISVKLSYLLFSTTGLQPKTVYVRKKKYQQRKKIGNCSTVYVFNE